MTDSASEHEQPGADNEPDGSSRPNTGDAKIAWLYGMWTLDILPQIGPVAAQIYEANPRLFRDVPEIVAEILAVFRYATGYTEDSLNSTQRNTLIQPILGTSDGLSQAILNDDFHIVANSMQTAAKEYVQRTSDTGEEQLREAFRDSVTTFRQYIETLNGSVVDNAYNRIHGSFNDVVTVLQDRAFASGLGLPPAPSGASWPFNLEVDHNGAALVEELAARTSSSNGVSRPPMDRTIFTVTQRVAHYGSQAIAYVLLNGEPSDNDAAATLIGLAYRWKTALRDLAVGAQGAGVPTLGGISGNGSSPAGVPASVVMARESERAIRGRS
ncbi:hypothetical protein [Pseudarthrobacter sp. NCCP-2145]|uniref:hypothetical protein n=1 Tax=Pseudarthrobacter sp. NCCP-2145 TaxID=2942290 RepID=UPI00203B3B02|nr:hypothetical protein [Pseudarthrobacter sp. NCCP-2145]GKV74455.1 hypothetical protein NCCP2145_38360 [Pseudarthrobacter sp. NCCP-2145]